MRCVVECPTGRKTLSIRVGCEVVPEGPFLASSFEGREEGAPFAENLVILARKTGVVHPWGCVATTGWRRDVVRGRESVHSGAPGWLGYLYREGVVNSSRG